MTESVKLTRRDTRGELEQLIKDSPEGLLRPQAVVEFAAQHPESALHQCFTWDDGEAAHQWRLVQARQVIRVHVEVVRQAEREARCFVSLTSDRALPGGGYRQAVSVLEDPRRRVEMLDQALRELTRLQQKYGNLEELAEVFAAADAVRHAS